MTEKEKELRERIKDEDTLLQSRTIAFLIGSGFFMNAYSSAIEYDAREVIVGIGLSVSIIWILIAMQTMMAIISLHRHQHLNFPNSKGNRTVFSVLFVRRPGKINLFAPTELTALWLPLSILVAWLVTAYHEFGLSKALFHVEKNAVLDLSGIVF